MGAAAVKRRDEAARACDRAQAILAKYELDKGVAAIPPAKPDLEDVIRRLMAL